MDEHQWVWTEFTDTHLIYQCDRCQQEAQVAKAGLPQGASQGLFIQEALDSQAPRCGPPVAQLWLPWMLFVLIFWGLLALILLWVFLEGVLDGASC